MKQVNTYIVFFICFASLVACDPCSDKNGDEYVFYLDNGMSFQILDKETKENLLYIGKNYYDKDTVKIIREGKNDFSDYYIGNDGLINLIFIDQFEDRNVIDERISRRFFMYFNYQDQDTIDIVFEMQRGECDEQRMKYFKVSYNDSTYFDGPTSYVPNFQFLK